MILAAVWKEKQSGGGFGLPGQSDAAPELAAIDASIPILEFCGQRNPFARRYAILIKELQRQLASGTSNKASPSSGLPQFSTSSSTSVTDSDPPAESPYFQNLRISEATRTFPRQTSYENESPLNMNIDDWPGQFVPLVSGEEESFGKSCLLPSMNCGAVSVDILTRLDPTSSFLTPPDEHTFWRG